MHDAARSILVAQIRIFAGALALEATEDEIAAFGATIRGIGK